MKFYSFFYENINVEPLEKMLNSTMPMVISTYIAKYFLYKSKPSFINKNDEKHFMLSSDMSRFFSLENGHLSSSLISYKKNTLKNCDWEKTGLRFNINPFAKDFQHIEINIHEVLLPYLNAFSQVYPENFNLMYFDQYAMDVKDRVIDMNIQYDNEQFDRVYNTFNFIKKDFINYQDFCLSVGSPMYNFIKN
jgi:hypothetical protein